MSRLRSIPTLISVLGACLAALLAIWVIMAGVASYKRSTVRSGWVETLGTREEILERFPSKEPERGRDRARGR